MNAVGLEYLFSFSKQTSACERFTYFFYCNLGGKCRRKIH